MKKKTYLPFPLFLLTLVVVGLGSWYTIKNFLPRAEPIGINEITSTGSVSLSLSPSTVELAPGTETTISLSVNSGTDKLSLVKFEITYDPSKVAVSGLTKGTWLTKELGALTLSSGKITGELGASPDSSAGGGVELNRTGSGTLLTFKAKGLSSGVQTLAITTATSNAWTITGNTPNPVNMLKGISGSTLTVSDPRLVTDLVGDTRKVDKFDYVELINQYGKLPAGTADFNTDGEVSGSDYTRLMSDYGKTW